ncbi:MAG: glycosyltransferase family 2 protein [Candidatus Gottesmanbacteria bacterium]
MNQKNKISVIILAKNESLHISGCIEHVAWADEVLVVDNGSTDETIAIAKKLHAHVIELSGVNFSALREAGAKVANGSWLLYIDVDEIVPKELQKEIEEKMNGSISAYYIHRTNYYLGQEWPTKDKMVRLIKKDALISWQGKLHEHPIIQGTIGDCKESLIHHTHRTLSEMVEKTNEWSEIEAELRMHAKHPRMSWWRFLRVMVTAFNDSFFKQQGWRAGTAGWVESIYQAFSMFITYAKLWERQQNKS